MDWTVLGVAALGVAGTITGIVLGPIITARQSQRTWLRQQRIELYSDALVHAETVERERWRLITRYDGETYAVGGLATPVAADLISARMELYGDAEVRTAWQELRFARSRLKGRVEDDYGGGPHPPLMPDDPDVRKLHLAIEGLSTVCRRHVIGAQP